MQLLAAKNLQSRSRLEQTKKAIGQSRAPATNKAYSASYKKYKHFCRIEGLALDDMMEAEFAFYLQGPAEHQLISSIGAAARRAAPPTKHKEPATIANLKAIRGYAKARGTCTAACTYTLAPALYASCSRLSETIVLQRKHIKIHHNYVRLFIPSSKSDQ